MAVYPNRSFDGKPTEKRIVAGLSPMFQRGKELTGRLQRKHDATTELNWRQLQRRRKAEKRQARLEFWGKIFRKVFQNA